MLVLALSVISSLQFFMNFYSHTITILPSFFFSSIFMYKNVDILKMCLNVKNIYLTIYFIYIHTHIHIRIWTFNLEVYVRNNYIYIHIYIYIYIYIYGCGKHLICISIQLRRHKKHWQLSIARRISAKYISCAIGSWATDYLAKGQLFSRVCCSAPVD